MSKNRGYNRPSTANQNAEANEPIVEEEAPVVEDMAEEAPVETPVEETPIVEEKVVEEVKESIPEIQEEVKPVLQVKSEPKKQGRVAVVTKNGCIVRNVNEFDDTKYLYGSKYMAMHIGDIIEF